MRLSQQQINFFQTCPRKFQHTFLDSLGSHISPYQQEKLAWGSRFHLFMQQREMGLPVECLLQEDRELQNYLAALIPAAPEIFNPQLTEDIFRQAEHEQSLIFDEYLLSVRYDLLLATAKNAQIIDWKTYPVPEQKIRLEKDWQTKLYLYVLAETSDYLPKQISLIYWFVKAPLEQPQVSPFVKFVYSQAKHDKTKAELRELLGNLTIYLKAYQEKQEDFPQVEMGSKACEYCHFQSRCNRDLEKQVYEEKLSHLVNLTYLEEVVI